MNRLNASTLKVLLAVISIHRRRPVTVRSICQELGWSSPNAAQSHIRYLIQKGLLTRDAGTARGLRLKNAACNTETNNS